MDGFETNKVREGGAIVLALTLTLESRAGTNSFIQDGYEDLSSSRFIQSIKKASCHESLNEKYANQLDLIRRTRVDPTQYHATAVVEGARFT